MCNSLTRAVFFNDDVVLYDNIFDNCTTKNNNQLTIVAHEGSTAQKYAQDNGMPFEILN